MSCHNFSATTASNGGFALRPAVRRYFAAQALLPDGWARDVLFEWNDAGRLSTVTSGVDLTAQRGAVAMGHNGTYEVATGPVLPGMPNLHSQAFQGVFSGRAACCDSAQDGWRRRRESMYRVAAAISPQQLEAVATWLYLQMLEAGYTSVCEFHSVHHDGADDATMAMCLMRAAEEVGIGMTLLPVLYQRSDFSGKPALAMQRRFIRSTDSMVGLLASLKPVCDQMGIRLGLAPHSLRAVPPDSLRDALAGLHSIDAMAPIHLPIAEQAAEIEACLAHYGQRPLDWLLDHVDVDRRWCLVHATHLSGDEVRRAVRSGVVAGLCPTTEANAGDGRFDISGWRAARGVWGIGSASQVCIDPAEELRCIASEHRLTRGQRNVRTDDDRAGTATAMWCVAVAGGAQAAARPIAGLAVGQQADFVVLDGNDPLIAGLEQADSLSAHLFASHRHSSIAEVWTAGRPRITGGRHDLHEVAAADFATVCAALAAA